MDGFRPRRTPKCTVLLIRARGLGAGALVEETVRALRDAGMDVATPRADDRAVLLEGAFVATLRLDHDQTVAEVVAEVLRVARATRFDRLVAVAEE